MAPRDFSRSERVSGQMRRELAQLIQREIKDPDVGFISVSDVEVTRDLAHAKVYVTVFNEPEAPATLRALKRAAGYLRSRLGQEMHMRTVPQLHFLHDASIETGLHMDRLIEQAVAADGARIDPSDGAGNAEDPATPADTQEEE